MLSLKAQRRLDLWDKSSIRPGPVGSIGDALVTTQLKSSLPGDFRWSPLTKGKKEMRLGSNVQDGDHPSWDTKSDQPRVIDSFFGGERDSITTSRGMKFQNIVSADMVEEPIMGSLPQYGWRNQKASIYNAGRSGEKFSSLPGGYSQTNPNAVPRGGLVPSSGNNANAPPNVEALGARRPPNLVTPYQRPTEAQSQMRQTVGNLFGGMKRKKI